ncbi:MAG: hypothetical protein R2758_09805 [Bacteroidales bacterium]
MTQFMEELTGPGSVTAYEAYGAKGGLCITQLMSSARQQCLAASWVCFPGRCLDDPAPLGTHYEFANDTAYLRERAYPVMKVPLIL